MFMNRVVQAEQLLTLNFEPHLPHHLSTYPSSLSSSAISISPHSRPLHLLTTDDLPPSSDAGDSMPPNAIRSPTSSVQILVRYYPRCNVSEYTYCHSTATHLIKFADAVPNVRVKSHVETQMKMTPNPVLPSCPVPSTSDRIGSWKWLKLPKGTSTWRRPRKEAKPAGLLAQFPTHGPCSFPYVDAIMTKQMHILKTPFPFLRLVAATCASDRSMPV